MNKYFEIVNYSTMQAYPTPQNGLDYISFSVLLLLIAEHHLYFLSQTQSIQMLTFEYIIKIT